MSRKLPTRMMWGSPHIPPSVVSSATALVNSITSTFNYYANPPSSSVSPAQKPPSPRPEELPPSSGSGNSILSPFTSTSSSTSGPSILNSLPPTPSADKPPSTSSSVASSAASILNSITSSFNYATSSTPPEKPTAEGQSDKIPSPPPLPPVRKVDEQNIELRTKYLTTVLAKHVTNVSTPHKLIYHLDDLFVHLIRHHKTLPIALEHGLIKSLMKILKLYPEEVYILNRAREVLAISGYNPPVKGPGISVLSIDGGGVRGLVAIEVLRQIENVTKKRIHELFDFICGVSTGSIIAFLLGAHHRTLDECEALYREFSREVFSQNSFVGAGSLMWSHAYYHTPTWEKILQKHLGKASLLSLARDPTSPRVAAISAVVSQERIAPYVFRTYAFRPEVHARYKGGSEHMMWEAVRASAAAPTYFEEMRIGNCIHQDGGILVNNPSSVALSEARGIWSGVPLQCVVSLGTGMTLSSRLEPHVGSVTTPDSKVASSLSWKGKFLKVLDSATDTESIHYTLQELLPKEVYFRFNPYVSEVVSLDEASPEKLDIIQAETRDYLQRNYERITCVGEALTKQKGITKKVTDWWNY